MDTSKKFLPIGTVVLLKGATKKIMITGFCMEVTEENNNVRKYDYCACLYPEGSVTTDSAALFNHDQIEKVFGRGYTDEEETAFLKKLVEIDVQKV